MSQADLIRAHARKHFVDVARRDNQQTVTIVAGEVAKDLELSNRLPNVCQALGSRKFFRMASVELLNCEGPAKSATTRFTYSIKQNMDQARQVPDEVGRPAVAVPITKPQIETSPTTPPTGSFAVVIQCAATKRPNAGHLTTEDDKPILFVADPATAPQMRDVVFRRPDDVAVSSLSWRDVLAKYNENHRSTEHNPLGLLPAWRLYADPAYQHLKERLGEDNMFILSAGWGLIPAWFLVPNYDITFAGNAEDYKRRRMHEPYADFSRFVNDISHPIHFLGGKSYVPLFCKLTEDTSAERVVHHVGDAPRAPGCRTERFETTRRTNWHYECARAFL